MKPKDTNNTQEADSLQAVDMRERELVSTIDALMEIVEGVRGERWAANGMRLVDTREWCAFYVASCRFKETAHIAWLEPLGSPCSLYRGYTLRVEVKVAGAWHADTNWAEHEIAKALAHAEETRNDKRRKIEDVRVIRMRFEVVGSGGSGSNEKADR